MAKPDKLLIPYVDDVHSRFHHVGRYGPGNLFMAFVTGAFSGDWWSGRYLPFMVESDGYFFGLVYRCDDADHPDEPNAICEHVMLEPNDIMFHPPWDSGEFST